MGEEANGMERTPGRSGVSKKKLEKRKAEIHKLSPEEILPLVEELQLYQVELEMQNEELRRIQVELEDTRDKYSDLFEHAPVAYLILGEKERILEANFTCTALLGRARRDLIGQRLSQFAIPEARDDLYLYLREVSATNVRHACEIQMQGMDGKPFFAHLESMSIEDKEGGSPRCRIALSDISDLKRAREALQKERDFVAAVLSTASVLIMVLDKKGRIIQFNKACQVTTGYSIQEVRGRPYWEIFLESGERGPVKEAFNDLNADKFQDKQTYFISTRDRNRRLIEWSYSFLFDDKGSTEYIISIGKDITEQRKAEEFQALTAQLLERLNQPGGGAELLPAIIESIKEFMDIEAVGLRLREGDDYPYFCTKGFSSDFLEAENSLCARVPEGDILGDERGATILECMCGNILCGRTDPSKPYYTEGGSFYTNSTTALLSETTESDLGCHVRNRCNSAGYESVALIPVRAGEEVIGLLQFNDTKPDFFNPMMIRFLEQIGSSIGMAIKRHRAEAALKAAHENMEQRVIERTAEVEQRASQLRKLTLELTQVEQRERQNLARTLHDNIQQLLVGVKFGLESLKCRLPDEDLRKVVSGVDATMTNAIQATRTLTNELYPLVLHSEGMVKVLEWLALWMKEKYGLSVEVSTETELEPIDKDLQIFLFQAVRELLFNIVKHAEVDRACIRMTKLESNQIRIEVTDEGTGIYARNDARPRRQADGFGLFSIRERIELLGGKLDIESAPGQGTRIELVAPLGRSAQQHRPTTTAIASSQKEERHATAGHGEGLSPRKATKIRILLAEDHEIVRKGLISRLKEEPDFEAIAEASDGETAVTLARRLQPDVVIMDFFMSHLSGLEATRSIKKESPDICVIGFSMYPEGEKAMRNAGASEYLSKGESLENLIDAIRKFAPAARS
jgi:PAS domain S-box-containing protein